MVGNRSGMSNQEEIQELREQLWRLVSILTGTGMASEPQNRGLDRLRGELGSRLAKDDPADGV